MILQGKMIPCQSREALIKVSSYHNGVLDGCLQHPRLDGKAIIQSLSQMILLLNDLLEMEACPGSPFPLLPLENENEKYKAVFRIQILFRENYTWQGRLVWQDENQETVFRSVIELIQLMDEILAE